jgi:hypothetical protein
MPRPFIFTGEAEQLFRSGCYTADELAKRFGCHKDTIYRTGKRLGVALPRSDMRRYKPNDHYFKNWSPEMAYVLGLLAADGHVTVTKTGQHIVMLNLKESDRELVERVRDFLEYPGPIYLQPKVNGETQAVLTITSKEMVNDLKKLGLGQHKTYTLEWPASLPTNLIASFCRGYFDGDGCISYEAKDGRPYHDIEATVVGTPKFIRSFKGCFRSATGNQEGHIQDKGAVSIFHLRGRFSVKSFLDWLYSDSTSKTRLSRKYNLYSGFADLQGDEEKLPNNSQINWAMAKAIRKLHQSGETVASIAADLNFTESLVHDVVQNRSWTDPDYHPIRKKGETMVFEHEGKSGTLTDWARWTGVPKNTIDRRLREGKSFADAIRQERFKSAKAEVSIGRAGMTRERATEIRKAYANGITGKATQEAFGISKSQYIDLIGNRVWKEDDAWWKSAAV